MRFLGIDYGKKRVGLALSDSNNNFSIPFDVLPNDKNLKEKIKKICEDNSVSEIVMGESSDFSGKANPIMEDILIFKDYLEGTLNIKVHLEPEFLTSVEAERLQGKNKMSDASAASLILKSFLERMDHRKNKI